MISVNARFLTQSITGVQRYAMELSKELKKLHGSLSFLSPMNVIHEQVGRQLEVSTFGLSKGHVWEQIELPFYLRRTGSPLLLNLANTAPLAYRDQIVTICDLSFLRNPKWFSRKFYYYYKFLLPKIAKYALKIITISEFSKSEILSLLGVPEDKVHVIYCGVPEVFIESAYAAGGASKYGEYILAVSSLDPRKNFSNLMEAFKRLNLPDIKLVIAGAGNRVFGNDGLRDSAERNIIFTGHVNDAELVSLYRNAQLFVYPSFYEGFGMPPLEAMICGCPVVVSNAASLPEICGDAARYVDPFNCDDISYGIKEVLYNQTLRAELKEKGLKRARLYNWKESAGRLMKIINDVRVN